MYRIVFAPTIAFLSTSIILGAMWITAISKTRTAIGFVRDYTTLPSKFGRIKRLPSSARSPAQNLKILNPNKKESNCRDLSCAAATMMRKAREPVAASKNSPKKKEEQNQQIINLSTITEEEMETLIVAWGHPKYRAKQVWDWIRKKGVTDTEQMGNVPKKLRQQLRQYTKPSALNLLAEEKSKDGTIKRAYQCHPDNQLIESVLMPYEDGRYTACISSQAGCAQGCVFCATGQMGFARQLTSDEIFEQVARFASELNQQQHQTTKKEKKLNKDSDNGNNIRSHGRATRLSNIVFMGMGEPLANYRNVRAAIQRITTELGISSRRITVSTVGIVPNIRKLTKDESMPPVRLAVSLHCATDGERDELMPVNRRYGGLKELMSALREYIDTTGRRVTLEWALIAGQNDSIDTARQLGKLIRQHKLRRDMVHVNVIPLNPTGGFNGTPTKRGAVNTFCSTLEDEFSISCTPRVRRGIDIDAGCGQLKSKVLREQKEEKMSETFVLQEQLTKDPLDEIYENDNLIELVEQPSQDQLSAAGSSFFLLEDAVDIDNPDDYEDPEFEDESELREAERLIALVQGTTINMSQIEGNEREKSE